MFVIRIIGWDDDIIGICVIIVFLYFGFFRFMTFRYVINEWEE